MHRSTWIGCVAVLLLAGMLAVGCGGAAPVEPVDTTPTTAASQPTAVSEEPLRVALVLPGSIADEGFNAAGYKGLLRIEEQFGAEVAYSEMVAIADHEETIRGYAFEGYDPVFAYGFQFGDSVEKVAPVFPDTTFFVVRGRLSGPNYTGLDTKRYEGDYVAGYIAARMSTSNKVGAIAGYTYPSMVSSVEAYRLGALAANPDIEVTIVYLDTTNDIGLGKEAALAQIAAGTDVIFQVADAAGIGVIQACEQEGVWAIGSNFDQNSLAPDTVITSTMVDAGAMMVAGLGELTDGTLEMDTTHLYGLGTDVVTVAPYHGLVPEEIAAEAEDLQQKIISGEVEVPYITTPTE